MRRGEAWVESSDGGNARSPSTTTGARSTFTAGGACSNARVLIARRAHRILCYVFLLGATVQFLLAGYGVFHAKPHGSEKLAESTAFDAHRVLGDVLQLVALLILIAALVGRRRIRMTAIFFVLAILQGFLAGIGTDDAAAVGALHPVNGLALIALAHIMARPEAGEREA